jgi:hypothetical protein
MRPNTAQLIYQKVSPLPDGLAQEILDFVDFVALKHQNLMQEMQAAQISSLEKIWGNSSDDVWNNAKTY